MQTGLEKYATTLATGTNYSYCAVYSQWNNFFPIVPYVHRLDTPLLYYAKRNFHDDHDDHDDMNSN